MRLLLLLREIESNPCSTKYPCGECNKPVRYGRSVACGNCHEWYHKSYIKMRSIVYDYYTKKQ